MHFHATMGENFKMMVKTMFGFENVLAKELQQLGAQNVQTGNRIVHFVGDKGFMYKANLSLRTALKILKPIYSVSVRNEAELYQAFVDFPWENYMREDQTFAFDSVVYGSTFTNSMFVSQKVKDALVDRFRKRTRQRPDVDRHYPDFRFHLHIDDQQCSLSIDTSGDSLHKRGYRNLTNIAPINEVLAAGMLQLAGWKGDTDFLDPMCGSGTLLIEAAMLAARIPAQLHRKVFAFEHWPDWEPELFGKIREAQLNKAVNPSVAITGFDKAPSAVRKAQENIKQAALEDFIRVERKNFFHSEKSRDAKLFLMTNPPYGTRLEGDIESLYRQMGDTFKQQYLNTDAWVISSNLEALKFLGLRPKQKIRLFNGKLETRLAHFPIYSGTKKLHKQTPKP